jgi:hypothetical protein
LNGEIITMAFGNIPIAKQQYYNTTDEKQENAWKKFEAVKPMKKIGYGKDLVGSKMLFFNSEQKWEKLLMKENRKGNSFFRDKILFC